MSELKRPSVVPILYVGSDLQAAAQASLLTHRVGAVVAPDARRAVRLLSHFRVAAIVVAVPDLRAIGELRAFGIPLIVLAARDSACDLDDVTVLRRTGDPEELAAVVHGLVEREPVRHAA